MIISPKSLVTNAVFQFKEAYLLFTSKNNKTWLGSNSLEVWLVAAAAEAAEAVSAHWTNSGPSTETQVLRLPCESHNSCCITFRVLHPLPFSETPRRTVTWKRVLISTMHVGSEKVKVRFPRSGFRTQGPRKPGDEKKTKKKERNRSRRKHKGRRARYYSGDE